MPISVCTVSAGSELVVLERESLRVEIVLRPFALTVGRSGRRLMRDGGLWVADGTVHDHFVQFTEGVVARSGTGVRRGCVGGRRRVRAPSVCS